MASIFKCKGCEGVFFAPSNLASMNGKCNTCFDWVTDGNFGKVVHLTTGEDGTRVVVFGVGANSAGVELFDVMVVSANREIIHNTGEIELREALHEYALCLDNWLSVTA